MDVVQAGCVAVQERFSLHQGEASRMDLAFEDIFCLEDGLAWPRFPVNIDGELLTPNHPISLGDDALGRFIRALEGRRVHLMRESGMWRLDLDPPRRAKGESPSL